MVETITRKVDTSHCAIATEMTMGKGLDVVLIHGNSSCRAVFERQLHSELGEAYRLICFDLPGHGQSEDAREKERTYPLPGLADAALEVLEALDVRNPVLLGWSLGGHVAIEMASRQQNFRGLFVTGTPPVGENISEGFRGSLLKGLAATSAFSQEQAAQFADRVFGSSATPKLVQAAARTDRDFRTTLFSQARIAEKSNQREVVSSIKTLTAVVNGAEDPIVNLDYIDHVRYANLWRNRCFRIDSAGHAPFLQNSAVFNHYVAEFLRDVENAEHN
jgi:pimeloyl-ACP methyl ester carboxylesterase